MDQSIKDRIQDDAIKKERPYKIFFKDLFLFKENEMAAKKKERLMNRSMKIYQKTTFSSRMKSRSHLGQLTFYAEAGGGSYESLGLDPTLILRLTEDMPGSPHPWQDQTRQRSSMEVEASLTEKLSTAGNFSGRVDFLKAPAGSAASSRGTTPTIIFAAQIKRSADRKRTVHEFINDQRDRFLLEYAVSTKKNTIQRFEKLIAGKENQLRKAEQKLQADAISFEEFLRENDQRSVDALKMAAQETINKLQMTSELKKASMEVQAIKSEIAKTEFLLKEYIKYGFFLLKLSPKHWQLQQSQKRAQAAKSTPILPRLLERFSISSSKRDSSVDPDRLSFLEEHSSRKGSQGRGHRRSTLGPDTRRNSMFNPPESLTSEDSLELFLDDETLEFDLIPEIYFNEPEELLWVLKELEEQNLTLVQYSQDVDENLEDVNKREKCIQDKINNNIEFLMEHKEMLKANCEREEEKAAELELRSRLFSFGEFNSEAQEKLIDSLSKKINQVYKVCIGDAEVGSLNAVQKLVKVESRLVELSDLIESVPKENVEAIERIKQKERRQKLREEKVKEKQKYQEERLKAALERAVAQPKKKLGRRLVYRSKPPSASKQELLLVSDTRTKSLEEEYFFS